MWNVTSFTMEITYQNLQLAWRHSRIFSRKFHRSSTLNDGNKNLVSDVFQKWDRGRMDPRQRRVVVTGSGMISPLGCHLTDVFNKAMNNESGICRLESDNFDYGKLGVHYVGKIPTLYLDKCDEICKGEDRIKSTAMKYAEFAAIQALEDVGKHF